MKIIIYILLIISLLGNLTFAQFNKVLKINSEDFTVIPVSSFDDSERRECPSAIFIWENNFSKNENGAYTVKLKSPIKFTCFGIGWTSSDQTKKAGNYHVDYKVKTKDNIWSKLYNEEGYTNPSETPTNMYWTDLLFNTDETPQAELEFFIYPPQGVDLYTIRLDIMDVSSTSEMPKNIKISNPDKAICPYYPTIIPRSAWCGSYTACHNTTSYTNITSTHTVIHHGASPDTYTDGYAVVRGYWNYHVNSNGWSDIGYNYLFDKYGNMFLGRHNPNAPNTDVRGAHAGASNDYSIGINFLGNADVTLPTQIQLDTLQQFLAWWYNKKSLNPTSSASIVLQSGGTGIVPRICGHKDVNIGGTSCPGTTLHGMLSNIRTNTKNVIDACSVSVPTNLAVTHNGCPDNNYTFSWSGSGTGWYIHISSSSNFSTPYIKWVSNLTSYVGPSGFVLESDGTTPLVLNPTQTYYWRIWNGTSFTNGNSFTVPYCDIIAPTTSISSSGTWKTNDFTATFTDYDNVGGSGLEKSFYQVLEFNGTDWTANTNRGFFGDNFDSSTISSLWTTSTGTWTNSSGNLHQSDETVSNTNIYAPLKQNLSNRYLYNFYAKIGGYGTNRRFGLHIFSDNASLDNRGNSYFIWFRIDGGGTLEFYKVTNNVIALQKTVSVTTIENQWYDYKLIFDRITGKMDVYRNDSLIGTWTDSSPISNGDFISFRTGNSLLSVNELKVYRSRYPTVTVSLGNDSTKDIRYQNPNPNTFAAKIKSIVNDNAGNLSAITYHDLNIDWSAPSVISTVNDGASNDIDTLTIAELSANWTQSNDENSDIAKYWYSIGTSAGSTDVKNWTDNGLNTYVTLNNINLNAGTRYYFNIKSENGAGLQSTVSSSDGALFLSPVSSLFTLSTNEICTGDTLYLINNSINAISYYWNFSGAQNYNSNLANPFVIYQNAGNFDISLTAYNGSDSSVSTINNAILVRNSPVSSFSSNDTLIYLPGAIALFQNNSTFADYYTWDFGDGATSSDATPWHIYTNPGNYTIKLISSNNYCDNDTLLRQDYIKVLLGTNIDEYINDKNICIYPNPINDKLFIDLNQIKSEITRIEILDITGNNIISYSNIKFQNMIVINDLNKLSKGNYIIRIFVDNSIKTYRITKI